MGPVDLMDTVERLQGGERENIIVTATVSDPAAIAQTASFILDLNRSNVAFSRTMKRLIVVVSSSLLNYIPAELEDYQSALLWKSIRSICSSSLASFNEGGHFVDVMTPDPTQTRTIKL